MELLSEDTNIKNSVQKPEPPYSSMFSQLEFSVGGEIIQFPSHELVYIANCIVKTAKHEKVNIPSKAFIDEYLEVCVCLKDDIINKSPDKFPWLSVIIPFFISQPTTVEQWLFLAKELSEQYSKDPRQGWWNIIGNRLLLVRTDESNGRHLFYMSDHGFTADIISDVSEIALEFEWFALPPQDNKEFYEIIDDLSKLLKNMTPGEFENYKDEITNNVKNDNQLFTDEYRKKLVTDLEDQKLQDYYFKHASKSFCYIVDILRKRLKQIEDQYDDFYETFMVSGEGDINKIRKLITFFVLREIIKEVNNGKHDPLFRPVYSVGISEPGVSYRSFAEIIDIRLGIEDTLKPLDLAKKMRGILRGVPLIPIEDDNVSFLSALIGSWFISEPARNITSTLYGLILLDFIESGVELLDDEGNNLYSWKHVLVHPKKPQHTMTKVEIRDLYGDVIDLAYFDGVFPMAHKDSVPHSKKVLGEKQKLSAVRQKEGHLLIDWLSQKIHETQPGLIKHVVIAKPESESTESQKCCLLSANNISYKEIKTLMSADEKPSKKIMKKPTMLKKWNILHNIIVPLLKERLSSLDCLIASKTVLKHTVSTKPLDPDDSENSIVDPSETTSKNDIGKLLGVVGKQTKSPIQTQKKQIDALDRDEMIRNEAIRLGLDQDLELDLEDEMLSDPTKSSSNNGP